MEITFKPIGIVKCNIKDRTNAPRHFSVSCERGVIEVFPQYQEGLYRIEEREKIAVIFYFHKSEKNPPLIQESATGSGTKGVFNLCSPERPNPIGFSILKLLKVEGNKLYVEGLDMIDGTPIIDIKPFKPSWESA